MSEARPAPEAVDGGLRPALACVILAHADPVHVRRLIRALDPFPVFLHVDSRASEGVYRAMTAGLPDRCVVLDRIATGWARWENVAAELAGYRAALSMTGATHLALMTGTDYPLAAAAEISALLGNYRGRSITLVDELPRPEWGRDGGFSRLRYRHWVYRKHMLRLPVPRRIPGDIVLAGGSQLKVLAREHARAVVEAADGDPGLVRFWRRSWIADETFVPSILSTPRFVPGWSSEHERASLWWIGWDGSRRKSPPWLDERQLDVLLSRRTSIRQNVPSLFARKFSTARSTAVLDAIDATFSLPGSPVPATVTGRP